jgi:hypothetical protein
VAGFYRQLSGSLLEVVHPVLQVGAAPRAAKDMFINLFPPLFIFKRRVFCTKVLDTLTRTTTMPPHYYRFRGDVP